MKYLRYTFAPRYGILMIRIRGKFYQLKAPWNAPLFSERHGFEVKVIPLWFGFRINIRNVPKDRTNG